MRTVPDLHPCPTENIGVLAPLVRSAKIADVCRITVIPIPLSHMPPLIIPQFISPKNSFLKQIQLPFLLRLYHPMLLGVLLTSSSLDKNKAYREEPEDEGADDNNEDSLVRARRSGLRRRGRDFFVVFVRVEQSRSLI